MRTEIDPAIQAERDLELLTRPLDGMTLGTVTTDDHARLVDIVRRRKREIHEIECHLHREWKGPTRSHPTIQLFQDWRRRARGRLYYLRTELSEAKRRRARVEHLIRSAAAGMNEPDDWRPWLLAAQQLLRIQARRCQGERRPEELKLESGLQTFVRRHVLQES